MPAVPAGATVLVTGASGYVGAWTAERLLAAGYRVRGTTRSDAKGKYLKDKFASYGDKFTYVVVADLEQPGGFDDAVKNVDAIAHVASPFHFQPEDVHRDMINPAVNGTRAVLVAAKKNGADVKRIVVTSSVAAIVVKDYGSDNSFNENDWNAESPAVVESDGNKASGMHKYMTSKTLAEKALWKFVDEEKPAFDVATVNPGLVLGPLIHQVDKPSSLNTSVHLLYKYLVGEETNTTGGLSSTVDVRDVAQAHVDAIANPDAANQRFIANEGHFVWQQAVDVVVKAGLDKDWPKLTKGTPGAGADVKGTKFDGSKITKVLGLKYESFDKTIIDTTNSLKEYAAHW